MPVLKLKPACKEYIWGGTRLLTEFHKEYGGSTLAETWELSCHPDGPSTIANGPWAGRTLASYIEAEGRQVLGENCRRFLDFPILTKLIDARDNLSIQVHPNNLYALKNEHQYGKTEMWYVVDCKEGAFLYYGFSREVDREEFRRRIQDNTLLEVLNKVYVQKGDVLFIEAGTIHAIGKDILIAEIQQNSNITYRVYDYGRVDKNNKPRDLHIEKALAVTKRIPLVRGRSAVPHLARCDYFTVDKLNLDGGVIQTLSGTITPASFASILVLEGQGRITCGGDTVDFVKGDSLFLPAGSGSFRMEGRCEALLTTIDPKEDPVRVAVSLDKGCAQLGLMDQSRVWLEQQAVCVPEGELPEQAARRIGDALQRMLDRQGLTIDRCVGIGVVIPGQLDPRTGRVIRSEAMGWEDVPFAQELQKHLPLPVYMEAAAPGRPVENRLTDAAGLI